GHAGPNPRIERAQQHRLPAAAGEACDSDARAIDPRIVIEVIEAAAHGEVEKSNSVGAGQIEQADVVVRVPRLVQLAVAEPFQVQRQHAPARLVDTALLHVLHGLAAGAVTVNIENGGGLPVDVFGFIEQRSGIKAGNDLVTKLDDAVIF